MLSYFRSDDLLQRIFDRWNSRMFDRLLAMQLCPVRAFFDQLSDFGWQEPCLQIEVASREIHPRVFSHVRFQLLYPDSLKVSQCTQAGVTYHVWNLASPECPSLDMVIDEVIAFLYAQRLAHPE